MKCLFKLSLVFLIVLGLASTSIAQTTFQANAAARLVKAFTLTEVQVMHFGTIGINDVNGGNVTLSALADKRTATGLLSLPPTIPQAKSGQYSITGSKDTKFQITLPDKFNITGAGGTLEVSTLSISMDNSTENFYVAPVGGTFDGNGQATFSLGGLLKIPGTAGEGTYNGQFDIQIQYN